MDAVTAIGLVTAIAGIALTILYGVSQTSEAKIGLQQVQNYIQDLQMQMLDRFDKIDQTLEEALVVDRPETPDA